MKTNVVDLRYKMKDVLDALGRRERVSILYHGKLKGIIIPASEKSTLRVKDHPFFGLEKQNRKSVKKQMRELRGGRYRGL